MARKLSADEIDHAAQTLSPDWQVVAEKKLVLQRKCKGFNSASHHAHLAAFISEALNHHADISFGWGYYHLTITTHDVGGLSELDFVFAARFDAACKP